MEQTQYEELLVERINKFLRDEISAATGYALIASKLKGLASEEIIEELQEHGKEEYEHYTELVEFAGRYGLEVKLSLIDLDQRVLQYQPTDLKTTVEFINSLEKEARSDYLEMTKIAEEQEDIQTMEFFKELANDETKHFLDLQYVNGDTLKLGESIIKAIRNRNEDSK